MIPKSSGQEGSRDLRKGECEALCRTLTNRTKKGKNREIRGRLTYRLLCALNALRYNCAETALWLRHESMDTATGKKNAPFLVEEETCTSRREIDDNVKHIFQRTKSGG